MSQLNLQPFAAWFFGEGWSVGYSGNILADWHASSGDMWTVPVGLAIGKVVKLGRLPVKFNIAGQYMPVHPSEFGQEWNVQVSVTPVLPKLFREPSSSRAWKDCLLRYYRSRCYDLSTTAPKREQGQRDIR